MKDRSIDKVTSLKKHGCQSLQRRAVAPCTERITRHLKKIQSYTTQENRICRRGTRMQNVGPRTMG